MEYKNLSLGISGKALGAYQKCKNIKGCFTLLWFKFSCKWCMAVLFYAEKTLATLKIKEMAENIIPRKYLEITLSSLLVLPI